MLDLVIADQCQKSAIAFCNGLDSRNYDRILDLVAGNFVWERSHDRLEGKLALRNGLDARPPGWTFHALSNFDFSLLEEDGIGLDAHLISYRQTHGAPALTLGQAVHRFRLEHGEWKLSFRSTRIWFSA